MSIKPLISLAVPFLLCLVLPNALPILQEKLTVFYFLQTNVHLMLLPQSIAN